MTAPHGLFDLAVNRAANTLQGLGFFGLGLHDLEIQQARAALEAWHARTRFARRVPLPQVMACLTSRPAGEWHWAGGPQGGWHVGRGAFP